MSGSYDESVPQKTTATWGPKTLVMDRYLLREQIGKGGMGEVWQATDQVVNQDVAVKFLFGAIDSDARRRFSAEVRAMARLDHPHIVSVLDQGEFDGAPFFVMTRLMGLPLGRWLRQANWEKSLIVFDQMLDALGYAHARGLIHRDLKPSNIIVSGTPEHPHAMVLDFGIAVDPWIDGLVIGEVVGSPGYMAPEQRRGETWRVRESTDLYCFGILLYEAITGRSPFGKGARRADALDAPNFLFPKAKFPLKPRRGYEIIAPALEPSLKRLLAFNIVNRPILAFDVREELIEAADKVQEEERRAEVPAPWDEDVPEGLNEERTELLSPWHPVFLEPRAPTSKPPPGAYGLYGLREPPMLGRERELKSLWKVTRQSFAGKEPHLVFLEGINGIGKNLLAKHLCELANELGLARFVEISYLHGAPTAGGIVACLEQVLRVRQAEDRESARSRLEAWLADEGAVSDALASSLLGLLRPSGQGHIGPKAKSNLFLSVLRAMCQRRPVIIMINDIQWCEDGSALYMLDELLQQHTLPVLALATVRVDEQSQIFEAEYPAILEQELVDRITLGPLPEAAMRSLLRSQVALEEGLEELLVGRSEGLPLLATQLLDELVRDGAIEDGVRGARLKPGLTLAPVPTSLRAFWTGRIARVAAKDAEGAYWVDTLQGLALSRICLTRPVLRCCGEALGDPLDDAVAAWEREGILMVDRDGRVKFCHSALAREVASQVAPEAAVRWHIVWAATLDRLDEELSGRYGLERGLHLIDAGEPTEALVALLSSAEHAHNWGDFHRSAKAASKAEELAQELGDRIRLAWALRWKGGSALADGQVDEADWLLNRARELFEQERVLVGLGATMDALAQSCIARAAYESAIDLCTIGVEAYRSAYDDVGLAAILGTLGQSLARLARYSEARAVLSEASDVSRRARNDRALAGALKVEGDVARYQGELKHAENAYAAAREIAQREWRAALPSIDAGLGLVYLARNDLKRAKERLTRAFDHATVEGQKRYQVMYAADLLSVAMLAGDVSAAFESLDQVELGVVSLDRIDEHIQAALERTLIPSIAFHLPEVVERTADLAARLWEKFGRPEEACRVREQFEQLGYDTTARG